MKKTFFVFLLSMSLFLFIACGGGGGGGSDNPTPTPEDVIYKLSVTTSGNGTVTYTEAGDDGGYKKGETVDLTATPGDGWRFDHWEGSVSSTKKTVSVKVSGDLAVTAVFIQQVSLTTSYTGNGNVRANPSLSIYDKDQEVTITATPASGWSFDHWSGSVTSTDNPLNVTMDSDKTIAAVFIKPSTLGIEEMKDVLHAAYSGIGYGKDKEKTDDSRLYGIVFDDLRWLTDVISMYSFISAMNQPNAYSKLLAIGLGSSQSFKDMTVEGMNVTLDIDPDGMMSTDPNKPKGIVIKMTVDIPGAGYTPPIIEGKEITYKGQNSSDLIFEGKGQAYLDIAGQVLGFYFDSYKITVADTLSASYDTHEVQYKTWTITASATGNEGKKLNYFIGPLMLYENSQFQAPNYDHRFYKLNGTFSIDGEDYFYDMLYAQLDGRYKPTVFDANAKYIGMQGSIRIPGLDGNLINISSPKSDMFDDIFNGKGIDTVILSDITGAVKVKIVPDAGVWETGSLSMIPAGSSDSWIASFSSDDSVEIDPGNYIVSSWQTALEFIN